MQKECRYSRKAMAKDQYTYISIKSTIQAYMRNISNPCKGVSTKESIWGNQAASAKGTELGTTFPTLATDVSTIESITKG